MTLKTHAMDRAMSQLSHRAARDLDARRESLAVDGLSELIHSFQLPISGTAGAMLGWTTVDVDFDAEFYDATEQRDSPYVEPNFTYGAVIPYPNPPVLITACVTDWTRGYQRNAIIGATIAIGVLGVGGELFKGWLHASFQGYGAPAENATVLDVGT